MTHEMAEEPEEKREDSKENPSGDQEKNIPVIEDDDTNQPLARGLDMAPSAETSSEKDGGGIIIGNTTHSTGTGDGNGQPGHVNPEEG